MTGLVEAAESALRLLRDDVLSGLPDYRKEQTLDELERLVGHPVPFAAVRDRLRMALDATPRLQTAIGNGQDSKDRLIDALQAQLRDARLEAADAKHFLVITEAKLEEARRALDRCMGFRS